MEGNPFEVGKELYNENKGMGLGVVVDVDDDFVKTEDVAGQTRKRPVTKLRRCSKVQA